MTFVSPSRRYVNWPAVIRYCKKHSGWNQILPNVPQSVAKNVRLRRHPDLRRADGQLEARLINTYTDESGVPRGDVIVRWIPREEQESND